MFLAYILTALVYAIGFFCVFMQLAVAWFWFQMDSKHIIKDWFNIIVSSILWPWTIMRKI